MPHAITQVSKTMKNALSIFLFILATSLPTWGQAEYNGSLPKVLIIGDSISIKYTEPLRRMLLGLAEVHHNPGDASHSGFGYTKLTEWLGSTDWDVIHFNHGLHDLKYVDDRGEDTRSKESGHIQIPIEYYEKNLEGIVTRLKKTNAKIIFATTTPYPENADGPLREPRLVEDYNKVAQRVMVKHNVIVNDLYTFIAPQREELQLPNNVHFTDRGSAVLASEVARTILEALGELTY